MYIDICIFIYVCVCVYVSQVTADTWPFPTLKKPHFALSHWDMIQPFEYAFIVDVDILFVRSVGIEVIR